jgi:hypothetical protein
VDNRGVRRLTASFAILLLVSGCHRGGAAQASSSGSGGAGGGVDPTSFYSPPPPSCAYTCATLAQCAEQKTPYVCPSLGAWASIPHASTCGGWDATYPTPVAGKCTSTLATGEAAKLAGTDPDDPAGFILPDGRRIHPAGNEWIFTDLEGGMTAQVVDVPGTPYVLTVDDGYGEHGVRSVDIDKLTAGVDPIVSTAKYEVPETLNNGLAFVPPGQVFVASNEGVRALTLDPATGVLTRNDTATLVVPELPMMGGIPYLSGVAASPDGSILIASAVAVPTLYVFSIAAGKTYGALLGQVDLGEAETFTAAFDPNDPTGSVAYVSLWANKAVVAVDLTNPAAPAIKATYATAKNPEGLAFVDARFMIVADANGDSVSVVDRTTGEVTSVPVDANPLHGSEPNEPAYDPSTGRLYLALGGSDEVTAYSVDVTVLPPTLTPLGALGTAWWPSGIVVRSGGQVVVTNLRGHGGGPILMPFSFGDNDIGDLMKGSIQAIESPSEADLAAGAMTVAADITPGAQPGGPTVTCPEGADDFPIPTSNTTGGSPIIDHIFFILRENKNFDSLLGDFPGVDGDPSYTLTGSTEEMDAIWHNFREAARAFALSDNYYTDAVFSTQGHVWATYGRSSDFNERTWAISGDRADSPRTVPGGGVLPVGEPLEGSTFDWLFQNNVPFDILGEIDGDPAIPTGDPSPLDFHYPGIVQDISLNDIPKACYASGRVRVGCNVGKFVYQTLPNDHTIGVSPTNPTPQTMCAVNDEATGMMLDAISHSPYWKSALIIVTEDDPSQGGENVDGHRTPLVMVSPWVKRGYVSKTHADMASLHRLYAHVLGLPYPNRQVATAPIPYDFFTSTPDYTPYTYTPRTWPLACGATTSRVVGGQAGESGKPTRAEEELTALWDFRHEDQQPGLGAQVWRAMRGTPLTELTPAMRARVERWKARAAAEPDGD